MVFPLDYIYPQGAPAQPTAPTPKSSGSGYYSSGAAPEHSGYYSNSQEPLHRVYPRGTNGHATSPQGPVLHKDPEQTVLLQDQLIALRKSHPRSAPVPVFVRPQELPSFRTIYVKERVALSPFSAGPAPAPRTINPGPNKGTPFSHGSSSLSRHGSFSKTLMPVFPYAPRSTTSSMRAECGSCASSPRSSQPRPPRTDPRYTTHSSGRDHKRPLSGPSDAAGKQSRRISSVPGSLRPPMEPPRDGGNGRSTLLRQPSNGMLRVSTESPRAGGSVILLSSRMSEASLRPPPDHVHSSSGSTLSRKRSMSSLPYPTEPFGAGGSGTTLSRQRSMGTLVGTSKPTRELKSALKKPARKGAGGPKKVSFSEFKSTMYYPRDEQ